MRKPFLLIFSMLFATLFLHAQTACDKLYEEAVRLQQTMTVNAQNQAIARFKKAKACYDAQDKQSLCQSQIILSQNIIKYIRAHQEEESGSVVPNSVEAAPNDKVALSPVHKDAAISFDNTQLIFICFYII